MERRRFTEVIAGGLLAAPLAAEAQHAGRKVYRIGLLCATRCEGPELDVLRAGLRDLGYVEGRPEPRPAGRERARRGPDPPPR
jgi:hypothetical protein